jgi:hypothetical protein
LSRFRKNPRLEDKTARYATREDFCRLFADNVDGLYQLAFLLTGDHSRAEQCFVSGIEDSIGGNNVFKEWSFFFIMPAITFSVFGFTISTMPEWLQYMTYASPLRYFLIVLRGTYLKGVGMDILWPEMLAMLALGLGLLTTAVLRFHKALD